MGKQRIWFDLLDAGRLSRYYAETADWNQRWHLVLSLLTVIGSLVAGTAAFLELPYLSAALFLTVASASAVMVLLDYSRKAQVARTISSQLREVEVELRRLWYREESDESKLIELEARIDSITRMDELAIDKKRNKRCSDEAYKALEDYIGKEPRATDTVATT